MLEKVKSEIDEKRRQKNTVAEYKSTVSKLLPRAREQVFRNLLLEREPLKEDYQTLMKEYGDIHKPVRLLAIRGERTADNLEQFIVENILGELLGETEMLLSVAIQKDVLLLIEDRKLEVIEKAVGRVKREFRKIAGTEPYAAVSNVGNLEEAEKLYRQIQEIYQLGGTRKETLLYYDLFKEVKTEISDLVDLERIQKAEDYSTILFEIYLALLKMEIRAYTVDQQTEVLRQIQQILYGRVTVEAETELAEAVSETVSCIAEKMGLLNANQDKEQQRIFQILAVVYQNIGNISLSMRYLAKNVLFMNEDYLGRVFAKKQNQKFSAWLMETRIAIAVRLMQYDDTLKNAYIAELTGYSADGQYFSKAFRKVMGITPTEYRKKLEKAGKE